MEREKHLEKIDDILGELQNEKFLYNEQQAKYAETTERLKDLNENMNDMLLQRDLTEEKLIAVEKHLNNRENMIKIKQTELQQIEAKKIEL